MNRRIVIRTVRWTQFLCLGIALRHLPWALVIYFALEMLRFPEEFADDYKFSYKEIRRMESAGELK